MNNYRIAYNQGWKMLKDRNFNRVSKIRDVKHREDVNIFEIDILGDHYILECDSEKIYNIETLEDMDISLAITLLNYLGFSDDDIKVENKWVSLKEIPNGGNLYYPAFYKSSIETLIKEFGYSSDIFSMLALGLGGTEYKFGDASAIFNIFPRVPICVVIWEGDDEISANATVLFDNSIQKIMHIESSIGVGMFITKQLKDLTIYLK